MTPKKQMIFADERPLKSRCAVRRTAVLTILWCLAGAPSAVLAGSVASDRADKTAARIDSVLGQLKETSRPLQGFSAEGTRVVAYARGGSIRKMEVEALGERGKRLLDFYWFEGRLVAARSRRIDYGADPAQASKGESTVDTVVEDERMSFAAGRPLRWQQLGRKLAVDSAQARQRGSELQGQARSFLRFMRMREPDAVCLWSCAQETTLECVRYQCK